MTQTYENSSRTYRERMQETMARINESQREATREIRNLYRQLARSEPVFRRLQQNAEVLERELHDYREDY